MRTADGHEIEIGDDVRIRVGGPYTKDGRDIYRVRNMRVIRLDVGRVRLEPLATGTQCCWRRPDEIYRHRENAKAIGDPANA